MREELSLEIPHKYLTWRWHEALRIFDSMKVGWRDIRVGSTRERPECDGGKKVYPVMLQVQGREQIFRTLPYTKWLPEMGAREIVKGLSLICHLLSTIY